MPHSLVTGGAGFMGAHVARELILRGHDVVVLDDLSGGFRDNVPPQAKFIFGSITDPTTVNYTFDSHPFDFVFHLAAYAAEGLSHFIRHFNYTNNLIGSMNLINALVNHGIRCFVFTSSIAVYGAGQVPVTEDATPIPEDPYGIGKYAVELDLKSAHEMFNLPYIIFRPHNVYGELQNIGDKYRNVIGIFINSLMQGRPMPIFGDGQQVRAFSYIGDVAPIIAKSVDVPEAYNDVFNIGSNGPYTINHLALAVARALNTPPITTHLKPRHEVVRAYADHAKAERVFGYKSKCILETGIARQVRWAVDVGPRVSSVFSNLEITKNLPSSWDDHA